MNGAASSSLARLIEKRDRGGLGKFAAEDLLSLERELRKLQEPHGRASSGGLSSTIGRIDDELDRRAT